MNNDKEQTIYDFDFSLVCEYFSSLERQGPGSEKMTTLALSFINGLTEKSKIADLGCGTGGQTATLAQNTKASFTALDLFPAFIDKLQKRFANMKLSDRVSGIVGSMDELPFADSEFDVIWCEGAIYNIGFKHGLEYWHNFIKTGGYVAVTEASWFTENRPAEIDQFWNEAYPEIDTIPNKVKQMQTAGYIPVATFILPEECWTDNFYTLQKDAQELFLKKHSGNATAENLIKYQRHEAELYSKYKQYYGYVFYIGKKVAI
jgi:ubiquinone/menaquinone biosynthesis C-methylase UbiE